METWPDALRYRGVKCAPFGVNLGGTAEGVCLSSQGIGTMGFSFCPFTAFQKGIAMKSRKKRLLLFLLFPALVCSILLGWKFGPGLVNRLHREPPPENPLPILMYHHVVEDGAECNDMTVTVSKLRSDFQYLADNGYTPILPRDLVCGTPLPEKPVMITFDDGYYSNYELLYPLLQEYQFKATVSVIVYLIDLWAENYCTWTRLREMSDSGLVEIGSHTYALHNTDGRFVPGGINGIQRRSDESDAEFRSRVLDDLQKSHDRLEEELGVPVTCFAYPFGAEEPDAEALIEELFPVTFITRPATADLDLGFQKMPRYTVTMEKDLSEILP